MSEIYQGDRAELEGQSGQISASERRAILMRADVRRRSQELKVDALNLNPPESTPERKTYYHKVLSRVNREASGEDKISYDEAVGILETRGKAMGERAAIAAEAAPNLSVFVSAEITK